MSTLEAQVLKAIATTSATNNIFDCTSAVSPGGDVYVTGAFTGTLDIGGGIPTVTTNTVRSTFLAKYSGTLTPLSLKYMSNTATTDVSSGFSVAVSPSGDVYVTGYFTGTLDIGGGIPTVTTNTVRSTFLAKYSGTLTPLSLKYMSNTATNDFSSGVSVAVSPGGDVYVTGAFTGTLDIGGGIPTVTTNTVRSAFLAKYSGTLTPLSLKYMSNTATNDFSSGGSVAVSPGGDVYVTGRFTGTLDIGGGIATVTTNTTNPDGSAFLAKYSGTLTPLSLTYMSNTADTDGSYGYSVAVSPSGDVYVTGYFTGTLNIGGGIPTVTTNTTNVSAFLARYSGTLTPLSLTYISNTATTDVSVGYSVAVSPSGDVYVTGLFNGTLNIGGGIPTVTTNTTNVSAFLARYSGTLTPLSLTYMSNTADTDGSVGYSVTVSPSGDVYVTGLFNGTLNIGSGVPNVTSTITGNFNGFLAKYTTNHNEPICLVSGTPILTDQGIVAIEKIDTAVHTISGKRIVAVTKAITPEKNLICFEPHSVAINCPTKRTIMTPGHEVLYKGKLVQAKHFVGKLNGVHTVPYDGKVVYNVLLQQHGVMSVNNMVVETLHPQNKVAKEILNTF
jgi:hypothetical protein